MNKLHETIEAERERLMLPFAPYKLEPVVRLPLGAVLLDHDRGSVYVTLSALATAFKEQH